MAERRLGPFLIGKQLGAGGMGIVYLATHEPTDKKVALKVLTPALSADVKLLKRFEREIDILKKMSHPNIVKYYGGGTTNGQRYYAMEFVDGGSLQDVLKKRKRLTVEQAIQVGRQLCSALEHAHNAGIIHRDLKPANLFINKKGRLKLGDFGIARDTEATALTAAGKTVGTYAYMAPEQIHGNSPISRKTDLYAVGCLLYETLTGETPFVAENPAEMLMQHLNDDPYNVRDKNADCPIWLDELIERMLSKNVDDRPYDALAVHTELTEMLQKLTESEAVAYSTAASFPGSTGGAPASTLNGADGSTQLPLPAKKKKKKKKKDQSPFFEQTWFLLICLAGLIGGAVWFALPPGEAELYELCKVTWNEQEATARRSGREKYMLSYLERFPEGEHVADVAAWEDQIEAEIYDEKRNPRKEHDYEIAYWEAREAEDAAIKDKKLNVLQPLFMYHAIAEATAGNSEARIVNILANQRVERFRQLLLEMQDKASVIREQMLAAETLFMEGRLQEAQFIWYHFREVFYGVREVDSFYDYCRRRTNGEPAQLPLPVAGSGTTDSSASSDSQAKEESRANESDTDASDVNSNQ